MKILISTIVLLVAVVVSCLLFLQVGKEIEVKLEVVKVHDCGHVDFKLTNLGSEIYYSGYEYKFPDTEFLTLKNEEWKGYEGFMCGSGLQSFELKKGESITFIETPQVENEDWRISLYLCKISNKPEWLNEFLGYFKVYEDLPSKVLISRVIKANTDTKSQSKCQHIEEAESDLEELTETSSIE